MIKFRELRADEIEVRVKQVTDKGVSLLLYKDARVDQNILDETVGPLNWQRHHLRDNANCVVSIWDAEKNQWIDKEDTGTESNTEAEKGLASDSFKRACFNWGIGRSLYTAPFVWVDASLCNIKPNGGKKACYDRFTVTGYGVENGKINRLVIYNATKKVTVYAYGSDTKPDKKPVAKAEANVEKSRKDTLIAECQRYGIDLDAWAKQCNTTVDKLTPDNVTQMLLAIKKKHPEG